MFFSHHITGLYHLIGLLRSKTLTPYYKLFAREKQKANCFDLTTRYSKMHTIRQKAGNYTYWIGMLMIALSIMVSVLKFFEYINAE